MNKLPLSLFFCLVLSTPSYGTEFELGGFLKTSARLVQGDLAYQHSWTGSAIPETDTDRSQFSAQESRLNLTIKPDGSPQEAQGKGFIEIDFSSSEQGNSHFTNSYSPRLRHAYIQYKDLTFGQNWTTFINTQTFAETVNLGGPLVGQAMIRQSLIRYHWQSQRWGDWRIAIENPDSYGTDINDNNISTEQDSLPDLIVRYDLEGQWGNLSIASLTRQVSLGQNDEGDTRKVSTFGGSIAGKVNLFAKDDLRFQLHYGELGRYVSTSAASDVYLGQAETTTAGMFAYRHFWSSHTRSSLFYGWAKTEQSDANRYHFGINLFHQLSSNLLLGFELGQFSQEAQPNATNNLTNKSDSKLASTYGQISLQLFL